MRVPTENAANALINQLNRLNGSQNRLSNQITTGQRVVDPSDDPAAMGRLMNVSAEKTQIRQYVSNAQHALDLSKTAFSAVDQLKQISDRAGELATLGGGLTSADARKSYAIELNSLIEQALQTGNTSSGGDQVFGGTRTDSPAFEATRDLSGRITSVSYAGAAQSADIRVSASTTLPASTDGATNAGLGDFMNRLVALRDALEANDPAAIDTSRNALADSEDHLLLMVSDLGSTQSRLDFEITQQTARFSDLEGLASRDADADLAQTVVRLTQAQTAYQAALQSSAQQLNLSLLDFIR